METLSEEGQVGNDSVEKDEIPIEKLDNSPDMSLEDKLEWETAVENPQNWPTWRKMVLLAAMVASAFTASIASSIVTPARSAFMEEFHVNSTVAILSVTLYVFALGFGPVVGGPLSETVAVGFSRNFGELLFFRFLSGFSWSSILAVAQGSLSETFRPAARGPVTAIFILNPLLGPGLGLYVSCAFGTLFSFFAAVPYTFSSVYVFTIDQSGLVFLSIAIGCFLGIITIFFIPPEHRLYSAMIGSLGLPLSLFWFGWCAREGISWAVPAVAIIPFAFRNICVFVSIMQYSGYTYKGNVVASSASANCLARYTFSGIFPLFTIQMYERLGIDWASSLLGFVALALLPIPWVLFKFGSKIRAKSSY
ncbi:hypothetical protein UA08_03457 [Talaromyces atroroseus]|uniref:Major facilitator superfamily (MFS) profile domain-containing protein n=1 Tax=Talaromyces atroroseus TaxID=1441469 RepID=A0A225APX9_TALAT|nr:hypothetical protein UA08_03457 [Talaromyces atroroseus]OKL61553.1 hypothetical protein UA08_03457 [Talaromyces atroroseus]